MEACKLLSLLPSQMKYCFALVPLKMEKAHRLPFPVTMVFFQHISGLFLQCEIHFKEWNKRETVDCNCKTLIYLSSPLAVLKPDDKENNVLSFTPAFQHPKLPGYSLPCSCARIMANKFEHPGVISSHYVNLILKLIPSRTAASKKLIYCKQEIDINVSDSE